VAEITRLVLGLVANPYHRGGITRWMVDLAAEWRRRGGRSVLVVPRPSAPFFNAGGRPTVIDLVQSRPASERPELHAPEVGAEFEFGTEGYRARVYAEAIRAAIPSGSPILTTDDPAAWRGAAAGADRYAVIGTVHNDEDQYYRMAMRFAPQLRAVVGVSRRITERMRATAEVAGIPITTIPCGTPLPVFTQVESGQRAAGRLIWVGRVAETQKRVSDLPKIARLLRDRGVEFSLTVIGDGPDRAMLESEIARLGVADRVQLMGWCDPDTVAAHLANSEILLIPSNFEGMSVTIMEALSAGCGVVASRTSGVEDYERDRRGDRCLWVHDIGDVVGAADAVMAGLAVPREERCARARQFANEEFSIGVCADRWAALFTRVVDVAPRTPLREHGLERLARLMSRPVAAARITRLWAAQQMRSRRLAAQGVH
jgi:glycosyltransferase involved in cell wall biosynthesis